MLDEYKIIDNFLDPHYSFYMHVQLLHAPHVFENVSSATFEEEGKRLYSIQSPDRHVLNQFIKFKIESMFKVKVKNINVNIQHKGMDCDFHIDPLDYTFLYMLSPTPKDESGKFILENKEDINYLHNRLIYFKAGMSHKGMSFSDAYVPRITIAFRTELPT